MSDQDSIFEEQKDSSQPSDQIGGDTSENPASGGNAYSDLLSSIRNPETGEPKYKSVEDALKALQHAQEFIPTLQQENVKYKTELEQAKEDLLKSAGAMDALDRLAPTQEPDGGQPAPQQLDEAALSELVERALNKKQTEAQQKQNIDKVKSALKEKYGDKAGEQFYSKAEQLGLDRKTMNELAAKSPNAVLAYFGGEQSASVNPNTSTVNSEGMKPPQPHKGPLSAPARSVMAGATSKDLVEEMRRHREHIYAKYGVKE